MIPLQDLLIFAAAALLMVLTPGPNMIYLISRSICQGRKAGVTSLLGVVAGFFVHLFAAAAGLTAVFLAVPMAYEVLKWAGALYLLWLAWQAVKPGARSPFEAQQLPPDSSRTVSSASRNNCFICFCSIDNSFLPVFICGSAYSPISSSTFFTETPGGNSCTTMRHWPRACCSRVQRARTRKMPRPVA